MISNLKYPSIAIVGSRDYAHPQKVRALVRRLWRICDPDTILVSGGGGIVDITAIEEAELLGMHWMVFPANWNATYGPNGRRTYDRGAGFRRNQYIIDQADYLIAFWDGFSKGTADDLKRAKKKGIPIKIFE